MSRKHLWAASLLIAALALSLAACDSGDGDDPTTTSGGSPVATTGAGTATAQPTQPTGGEAPEPENPMGQLRVVAPDIAPGTGLGSAQAPVEAMQYWGVGEGLFVMDNNANVQNKLATGFTLASDLSYVDITLRDDVVFHKDFGPFSADDVVYTLNDGNANTNPTSIHGQAGDFAALFGEATKIDANTVRLPFVSFDLRWNGNFLNEQAQGTAFFSKKAFDDMGEDWMRENIVSTGPFEVVEWIQDDHATLTAVGYDHWYKNPEIEQITFVEVADPAARVSQLRTGAADVSTDVAIKDIRSLTDSGFIADQISKRGFVDSIIFSGNYWEDKHARTGEPIVWTGIYNNDLAWQGNPTDAADMAEARDVRWALALAIDRQLIIDTILDGNGVLGSTEYVDTTASYFKPEWLYPYDPTAAKARMSGTTWPQGKFAMGIWTGGELGGGTGTNGEINDAIAGMWLALWPEMQVQVFKSAYSIIRPSLVGRTNTIPYAGDCDEGSTSIPFDWPHGLTETTLTRGGYGCAIEIPKIAETYLQVAQELDLQKRIQLNTELIDYIYDQALMVGVVQVPSLTIYNPKSIESWEGSLSAFAGSNEYENIVPAAR